MKINPYISLVFFIAVLPLCGYAQEAPQLLSPENGASGLSTSVTLQWSEVSSADVYQIEVAETSNFDNPVFFRDRYTSTSIQVTELSQGKTYFWRVRAGEQLLVAVQYGEWSEVWSFRTAPPAPGAPTLVSPENGADEVSTGPVLDWNASEFAEEYRVQISASSDFSATIQDHDKLDSTELQITGLENSTTYYWRVNAANETGTGDWSDARNFTTVTEPPPAPALMAPENNAANISTTTALEWESVETARTYDFQIALDEEFNNKIIDQTNVTSTTYQGNFDEYTLHYWRVRARNTGGDSPWSDVWNFTTETGDNVLSVVSPEKKEILTGSQNHSVRWQSTNRVQELTLEYSTNSGKTWNLIDNEVDAFAGSYSWTIPDSSTTEAQIRITDNDNPDLSAVSELFILYPSTLSLEHQYRFHSARVSSDYQLIGLPAADGIPADDIFTGRAGTDWNIYYDNGNEEDYLVPYDTSEVFTLQPGRGFWAISRSDVQVSESSASVELSPDTTFSISLHEGWNIISNPFNKSVPWDAVQVKNEITDPIWTFNGTFREISSLRTYEGYYFYNRNGLEELVIPYIWEEENQPEKQNNTEKSKFITLTVLQNDTALSSIEAGITMANNTGPLYDFAPPGDFQDYRITIQSDEFSSGYHQLARLFMTDQNSESYNYDISIQSPAGEPLRIRAEGLANFNSYEVLLVDKKTSKTYDLHQNPELRLNSSENIKQYRLIVGYHSAVAENKNQVKPKETQLFQNFPNPFNNQTVIEYSIGDQMANQKVLLEVFNVVGQRIATLVNEPQPAGFYQVNWNTEASPGQELASGLYFYRLQIGQTAITNQLTLIK